MLTDISQTSHRPRDYITPSAYHMGDDAAFFGLDIHPVWPNGQPMNKAETEDYLRGYQERPSWVRDYNQW